MDDDLFDDMTATRDAVLLEMLGNVAFDGWTDRSLREAGRMAGIDPALLPVVFAGGVGDVLAHLSEWADRQMAQAVADEVGFEELRLVEKVAFCVRARLEALGPHREAIRRSVTIAASPRHARKMAAATAHTVNFVWELCGDASTDINFYTKRGLLGAVMTSTTLYWLGDSSENHEGTWAFLDRRLQRVLSVGRAAGQLSRLGDLAEAPWRAAAFVRRQVVRE